MSAENPVRAGREGTQGRLCDIMFHSYVKAPVRSRHVFSRALCCQDPAGLVFSSCRFASFADNVSSCR